MSGTHSRGLSQERASTATYSKMFILYICKSTPDIYPKLINNMAIELSPGAINACQKGNFYAMKTCHR